MNVLAFFYRRSRLRLAVAMACAVAGGLCGTALIKTMTDGIMGSRVGSGFALTFFALCVAQFTTRSSTQLLVLRLTQDAVFDLRLRISAKILSSPLRKLEEIGNPRLLVVLSKDIENFANCLQIAPQVFASGIVILFCLGYLAWLSWVWFAMLAVVLGACLVMFRLAQRAPTRQLRLVRDRLDVVYRLFRDLLEGTKELQLNRARGEHFLEKVIDPEARAYRRTFLRGFSAFIWIVNIGDILFYAVIGLLLFMAPGWLGLPMPVELRVRIGLTLLYLIGPISTLSNAMPVIGQASIALEKILQLDVDLDRAALVAPVVPGDPFEAASDAGADAVLELDDVVYEYAAHGIAGSFRMGPINARIPLGEITFIVGHNGSGKSTLAKMLSGLYVPESGRIRLHGVALDTANVDHYRRRFSAVFADFHLFEHLMGVGESADEHAAANYLKKLRIDHKVSLADGRFSTVDLSTGQKKRLALIVSYLEDRPICLFDEWAADQDPVFKRFFYAELLPELRARGKTVIAISHDDAYFHHADRIIRLEADATPAAAPADDDTMLAVPG